MFRTTFKTTVRHRLGALERRVADLEFYMKLNSADREEEMKNVDELRAAVEAETSVIASTVALLDKLTTMIEDSKSDDAALAAVIDEIKANKEALAKAVVANTPAEGGSTGGIVG